MNTIVKVCVCLITTCSAPAPSSLAQISIERPALVKNINTAPVDGPLTPVAELNGMLIFTAFTPGSGWELWKSDGSEWGAVRIKDINPGPASAFEPRFGSFVPAGGSFVSLGGLLLFAADDGINGVELWKTDGTENGTVQVKDILAGPLGSRPKDFLSLNGLLYFTAAGGGVAELWQTDGTTAGTRFIKRLPNDGASALAKIDGTIFFTIGSSDRAGLWKSDGTEAGTILLKPIPEHELDLSSLIEAKGRLFFTARDPDDYESSSLWTSDGTAEGTAPIRAFSAGGYYYFFTVGSILFFGQSASIWMSDGSADGTVRISALRPDNRLEIDGTTFFNVPLRGGIELWKSDGTSAGTSLIYVFPIISNALGAYNIGSANGMLLLGGNDDSNGIELWRSDGTPEGTVLVKDIVPGPDSSSPVSVANLNGAVLFTARDSNGGLNLWKSDGTENGTTLIALIERFQANLDGFHPYVYAATVTGNKAVFMVGATTNKVELWTTDGTGAGTHPIREFDRVPNGAIPSFLSRTGGTVFIAQPQPGKGLELWRTDGTSTGTFQVREAYSRDSGSVPGAPVACNGAVFFTANASELWKSDGTETGTIRVKAMSQGQGQGWGGYTPYNLVNVNGTLFFAMRVPSPESDQYELWKSDGNEKGTVLVKALDFFVREAINLNGQLFIATNTDELWKSDGTESGTELVKQLSAVSREFLRNLVPVGSNLFFTVRNSATGQELWKTDGTEAGTILVKDSVPGPGELYLGSLVNVNGTLFFISSHQGEAGELWKSDGTPLGTVRVKKLASPLYFLDGLVALGGMLYFAGYDATTGEGELWRSDGTESGTKPVRDINPGPASFSLLRLTRVGETLFFWVYGDDYLALWKSDGTETGTTLVADNIPLPPSEVAGPPVGKNGVLYFFGYDDRAGRMQIWRSDGTAAGTFALPDPAGAPLIFYTKFSYPSVMVEANGTIFLRADDGVTGFELWKIGEPDNDSDGLPDWWESKFFSKNANPEDDPDGDGLNNREELRAGTDPTSPSSVLKLTQIKSLAGGKVQLEWPSVLNQEYVLLRSSTVSGNLRDFTTLERRIRATPPVNSYVDATARGLGPYFYRLKIEE